MTLQLTGFYSRHNSSLVWVDVRTTVFPGWVKQNSDTWAQTHCNAHCRYLNYRIGQAVCLLHCSRGWRACISSIGSLGARWQWFKWPKWVINTDQFTESLRSLTVCSRRGRSLPPVDSSYFMSHVFVLATSCFSLPCPFFISVSHILLRPALLSNKEGLGWFEDGPKPLVRTRPPQKGVVSGRMHMNLGVAHHWCGRFSTKITGGITLTHHFLWGDWRRS